jgi:hypothetical protein
MDVRNRDRLNILYAMYEVINESGEWCFDVDNNCYAYFIQGVFNMAGKQLEEIDKRPIQESKELESDDIPDWI